MTVRWGETGMPRRPKGARVPPVCVPMGPPDAEGWREAACVVRIPADTLRAAIIFSADRERDPTVAYRDFRLYRLMGPQHETGGDKASEGDMPTKAERRKP